MDIIIIGSSGFALETAWLAEDCGYNVIGFLDDASHKQGTFVLDKPVLGKVGEWESFSEHFFIVAVGSPRTRLKIIEEMTEKRSPKFATLVHPSVNASKYISLGEGTIICAGCILTVHVNIGCHCIVNLNSTIGHEVSIGDFSTIAPIVAISGNVVIDDLVEIGTGASIRQGLTLGKGAMLGMGSVLTKDCLPNNVYAGVPARSISKLEEA